MLKPLQPGILPLGQFDLADDKMNSLKGGEVGVFQSLDTGDGYAADSLTVGPQVQLTTDSATDGELFGLLDEGDTGYGTMFGSIAGGTAGQGTGFGTMSSHGAVVVGPKTTFGSGKATLWAMPGLYGVSVEAFSDEEEYDALSVNTALYGVSGTGKLTSTADGDQAALSLGLAKDTSLVSTTNTFAGATVSKTEYAVVFLLGVQH